MKVSCPPNQPRGIRDTVVYEDHDMILRKLCRVGPYLSGLSRVVDIGSVV